jgi:hypothetical protein
MQATLVMRTLVTCGLTATLERFGADGAVAAPPTPAEGVPPALAASEPAGAPAKPTRPRIAAVAAAARQLGRSLFGRL